MHGFVASGSWYTGHLHTGLKDGALEASTPICHMTKLIPIVESETNSKPILFLCSDGGPDHRLTYISQLTPSSLFLLLDLDNLCAARTATIHSWHYLVERMVNLGLHCVRPAHNLSIKKRPSWLVSTSPSLSSSATPSC